MKTDRELLELAAKAAGKLIVGDAGDDVLVCRDDDGSSYFWSPLSDDGDALRLAVMLGISPIQQVADRVCAAYWTDVASCNVAYRKDPYAATRRAIVRAAAEIGSGRSVK